MSIELTTADPNTIKELKRALGIATLDVLLPNYVFRYSTSQATYFATPHPTNQGIIDFTNFGNIGAFNPYVISGIGLSTIIGADKLVNLEDYGTMNALYLNSNPFPLSALNIFFNDLPPTTKTATINLQFIAAIPQSNYRSLTAKGYSVVI